MHYKVWDEITYPFPNLNGCTDEVWEATLNCACDYLSMPGLKLIHVSKRGPWSFMQLKTRSPLVWKWCYISSEVACLTH